MVASRWLRFAIPALAVLAATIAWASYSVHKSAAESPTLAQWQTEQVVNNQLKLDPKFRQGYAVHQRFMDLYTRMPTFDRAWFPTSAKTVFWRSTKWTIAHVYVGTNGQQYVSLGYAQGPGTDQGYAARLIDGRYVGAVDLSLVTPKQYVAANELTITCRDARNAGSRLAAVPATAGGPTLTDRELESASLGVSDLPGVVLACYRFSGMDIVELVHGTYGVLFRIDGSRLEPLVRGYIAFADRAASFMIVQADAGYDSQDMPITDYLEVIAANKVR